MTKAAEKTTEKSLTWEERGKQLQEAKRDEVIKNSKTLTARMEIPPEVQAYMDQHVNRGIDDLNVGVVVPQLRIHSAGVSSKNELEDGSDPIDGQIYYTGSKQAFDVVTVTLLVIKKCRLEQKDKKTNKTYMKANYLVAGVISDTLQPFVIYVKGMSYNKVWDLEEQLKPFVTKRAGGIPLSMLRINVSSTKEKVLKGEFAGQKKNVFKFELALDALNGDWPMLDTDIKRLKMLDRATESAEDMLNGIISQNNGMSEADYQAQHQGATFATDTEEDISVTEIKASEEPEVTSVSDTTDDTDIPF